MWVDLASSGHPVPPYPAEVITFLPRSPNVSQDPCFLVMLLNKGKSVFFPSSSEAAQIDHEKMWLSDSQLMDFQQGMAEYFD